MNSDGKSDDFVLPTTQANKAGAPVAEFVEESEVTEGKRHRTVVDAPDTEPDNASLGTARWPRHVAASRRCDRST
jgi:hypothetical protein